MGRRESLRNRYYVVVSWNMYPPECLIESDIESDAAKRRFRRDERTKDFSFGYIFLVNLLGTLRI